MPLPDVTPKQPGGFRACTRRLGLFLVTAVAVAAVLAGCGGEPEPPAPVYSGIVAATEFVAGAEPNRFPFALVDKNGAFLEGAEVSVRFFELDGEDSRFHAESKAVWREVEGVTPHLHDDGELHLHLDYAGRVRGRRGNVPVAGCLGRGVRRWTGGTLTEGTAFQVQAEAERTRWSATPAPRTANLTIHDAPFAEISTRPVESDELHNVSVAEAIDAGKPFVVFFASPQFCVSALCGPVTDTPWTARTGNSEARWRSSTSSRGTSTPRGTRAASRRPRRCWNGGCRPNPGRSWWTTAGVIAARYEGLVTTEEVVSAVRVVQARLNGDPHRCADAIGSGNRDARQNDHLHPLAEHVALD